MKPSNLLFAVSAASEFAVGATWATPPNKTSIQIVPTNISLPPLTVASLENAIQNAPSFTRTYENSRDTRQWGLSQEWLEKAIKYWQSDFDWRKVEKSINRHPHFIANVTSQTDEQFQIHFMALFSQNPDAIPIALFHGWPGSFLEFLDLFDVVKLRYSPASSPFHLIVPSLPGFTLSDGPPVDVDWGTANTSSLMDTLMRDLGFGGGYVAQGGDIGSFVARTLGLSSPSCKAIHLNFIPSIKPDNLPAPENDTTLTPQDHFILTRSQKFVDTEQAYALQQGTKPATLGFVLESSPIALLAWLGEKFNAWTDPAVQLALDRILTSVSMYHLTHTISRSFYTYRETSNTFSPPKPAPIPNMKVPIGYSRFPYDNSGVPKKWAEELGNVTFFRAHERGGHFAAMEYPVELWEDIEAFVLGAFPDGVLS